MFRRVITIVSVAAAMIGASATRAAAACPPNTLTGPFCIDGVVTTSDNSGVSGVTIVTAPVEPAGSTKELGPINGSSTKIGVINTAPTPMLGLTNPNGQVDLNTVYTQTAVDPANGHIWYYFGWRRDSNSGSGFISIELQQSGVPLNCSGLSGYNASNCNPWSGRLNNDFLILWDQSGSSTDILKRVFTQGLGFGASAPFGSAKALFTSDGFGGELAIDFTADVFPSTGECQSFANTIPGTVTGNSDTADYKDTVLSAFPPVTNCGIVTVKKVTSPASQTGTFKFTLSDSGSNIFFSGKVDSDCANSADVTKCEATLTQDGDSRTITNLIPGNSNYQLAENVALMGPSFQLTSISCTVPGSSGTVSGSSSPLAGITVKAGAQTDCTITNTVVVGNLDVVKVVVNKFGLAATCDQFSFADNGGANVQWPAGTCVVHYTNLTVGGVHTIVETVKATGFNDTYDNCSGVTITAGSTQTCTVTNTATQNTPAALTRQRVLLFDRANLSNIRRDPNGDNATMSVKFIIYSTSAACSADTTGTGGDASQTTSFNISGTATFIDGIATANGVEVKLDVAGSSDTTKWWRALFHQTGTNPPNADFLTPCTETTQVVFNQ
jgi:hypothetical protein